MAEKSGIKDWRNWIPLLIVAVIVASVGLGIHNNASGPVTGKSFVHWLRYFVYFTDGVMWAATPCLLAAAVCLQNRRLRLVAAVAVGFVFVRLVFEALYYLNEPTVPSERPTQYWRWLVESGVVTQTLALILLIVLPRLRRVGWVFQGTAMGAVCVSSMLYLLIYAELLPGSSIALLAVRVLASVGALISVPAVAFCAVYQPQIAPHAPPIDAGQVVNLTCPRCQSAQTIPTNGGRCANCRLDIFIALKEGVCRKCHYPLRGLTTAVCPECGTAVAEGAG